MDGFALEGIETRCQRNLFYLFLDADRVETLVNLVCHCCLLIDNFLMWRNFIHISLVAVKLVKGGEAVFPSDLKESEPDSNIFERNKRGARACPCSSGG